MKKIIKLCFVVLIVTTLLTGCGKKETYDNKLQQILATKKIVMVTSPDFPPNEFIDSSKSGTDQYVGSDIELGKYIAEKLGVELVIEAMDFPAVLGAITTGKADMAISGFGWKKDRAESMLLSDGYNFSEDEVSDCHGILIKEENLDLYKTMSDFDGKKIAAQLGSLQEGYTKEQIKDVNLEIISTLDIGLLSLQTGKIDGMAMFCTTGNLYEENTEGLVMSNVYFDAKTTPETSGTRIGLTKGETELAAEINKIIAEVVDQGLYAKWIEEASAYATKIGAK